MSNQEHRLFSRREVLKLAGAGVSALLLQSEPARAASGGEWEDAAAVLYDSTRCIGCRACEEACKEWNDLPPDTEPPSDLTARNFTLIKEYYGNSTDVFRKYQCMHCLEPACVSACPVHALQKLDSGPVAYDASRCIGCRYCMVACPFHIPRIDWNEALPLIKKCTFCADRQADGLQPACVEACPTDALTFGTRGEMLEEARSRIEQNPDQYFDHIYGETEAGGTSWLYLSPVSFDKLGFPTSLGDAPVPALSDKVAMFGTPSVLAGVAALLGGIYWTTKRRAEEPASDVEGEEEV
jgi:formate dehydrogenase beta subunit